ncbi:TonB-dependent receptor plug domain-containing protein, partial [Bacteroidota bacterium]
YLYEDPYDSRYVSLDSLNRGRVDDYSFRTMGTNLHRFFRETTTKSAKFDFTSQVDDNHMIKLGAEGKIHTLKYDDFNLIADTNPDGSPIEPFQTKIPDDDAVTRNLYEESPLEWAAYIQDKIEFEAVIINIGLRFDYFDSRGNVLVDPTDPNIHLPLRAGLEELSLAEREPYFYKDAAAKSHFSPRFGIAYPTSPFGVLHFSYGHFLQIPSLQYLFDRASYKVPRVGDPSDVFGNPDLEPQKTIMYEIGFRQELFTDYVLDVTMFYRDIRNWISSGPKIITRNLVGYSTYINKDYANVKGITLNVNKRFTNNFSFYVNYTFQIAEGSNSKPDEEFDAIRDNRQIELFLIPLEWDQTHLLNASLYVGGDDWGSSIVARYGTGLPYTPSITQYTADRGITVGLMRNSRRRPAQFTIDWYVNKSFNVFDYEINAYVKVLNLLDSKVVVNVFGDTGKADYTTLGNNIGEDPARPNTVAEYQKYPHHYGEPRLVQFGLEINF